MKIITSSESFNVSKNTTILLSKIRDNLNNFLENKEFGKSLEQIFYVMKLVPKPLPNTFESKRYFDEYVYQPRAKRLLISPLVRGYEDLLKLENENEIFSFFAHHLLEDFEQMRNTTFKDFDTDKFLIELKEFVQEMKWV